MVLRSSSTPGQRASSIILFRAFHQKVHSLSQGCTCTRAVLRTSSRPGQCAPTADASCDKATPCNVTVLVVMLGATFLLEVYCHTRECTEWMFESAIILDSSNGTSLWLLGNRYMEKLAKHVLLISLHWAPEQSLFLSWWSGTPLCIGKAAAMHCLLWEIGESADTVQWFLRIITYRWHLAGKGRQGPRLSIRIDIWILPSLYLVMT